MQDREAWIRERCPKKDPKWDPNTVGGLHSIQDYQKLFMDGMRVAGKKPTNFVKVRDLRQSPTEFPDAFYERFMQAYQKYTSLDLTKEANEREVVMTFVSQSAPDIRKKLSKKEGLGGLSIRYVLEVAREVFDWRDEEDEKTKKEQLEEQADRQTKSLVAALTEQHKLLGKPGTQSENVMAPAFTQPATGPQPLGYPHPAPGYPTAPQQPTYP